MRRLCSPWPRLLLMPRWYAADPASSICHPCLQLLPTPPLFRHLGPHHESAIPGALLTIDRSATPAVLQDTWHNIVAVAFNHSTMLLSRYRMTHSPCTYLLPIPHRSMDALTFLSLGHTSLKLTLPAPHLLAGDHCPQCVLDPLPPTGKTERRSSRGKNCAVVEMLKSSHFTS